MPFSNPLSHLSYNPLTLIDQLGLINHHNSHFKLSATPSLAGKIAVVTGGQGGIGKEITAQLLLHGIEKVFVLARGEGKFEEAIKEWRDRLAKQNTGEGVPDGDGLKARAVFVKCDLGDIKDVAKAADSIKSNTRRIDILVNNAGTFSTIFLPLLSLPSTFRRCQPCGCCATMPF
jgi:NAD(P)-dependent dehydrogenase (short-subunit alcohol dehydrogenase family)